eukprot:403372890
MEHKITKDGRYDTVMDDTIDFSGEKGKYVQFDSARADNMVVSDRNGGNVIDPEQIQDHDMNFPSNPKNLSDFEISSSSVLHSYQTKTKRMSILMIVVSLFMMAYGLGSAGYDMIQISDYENGRHLKFIDNHPPSEKGEQNADQEPRILQFNMDKFTFMFLNFIALSTNAMTIIQGIVCIYIAIKAYFSLNRLRQSGNNPNELETQQQLTGKMGDYVKFMILFQVMSAIAYSLVYTTVLMKAFDKFESQSEQTFDNEDRQLAQNLKTMIITRCAIILAFYTVGCSGCFWTFRSFQRTQQKYEDIVMAQPSRQIPNQSYDLENSQHKQNHISLDQSM